VEDDRQRLAQRESRDAQGDGSRGLGVDERPSEQIVGVVVHCFLLGRIVDLLEDILHHRRRFGAPPMGVRSGAWA
jgi:hypothetical protein